MTSRAPAQTSAASPVPRDVLVTGASGFLGSRLVKRLAARGVNVTCTARRAEPSSDNVTWRECDLTEEQSVRELLVGVRPEVVLHLAGHVSGRREPDNVRPTLIGNLVATVHVLLAALAVGSRRVVLAGSYEEPEADAAPRSPYAASKIGATAYARLFSSLYGLSTVVLRPTMIYGPGQRDTSKLIPYVTRCFLAGEAPVLGSGQRPIDWVYVDDVADAFVLAATAPKIDARVIDIGSGELHTIVEIVEMLAAETRATVAPHYGGLADRPAECVIAADPEPARRLLGWRAVTPLADGLARTVADVRARARAEGTRPGSRDQRPSGT